MKRNPSLFFGFLGIISIFLFAPAFIECDEAIETNFVSSGAKYEDQDIEDFLFDKKPNFAIVSGFLFIFPFLGSNSPGSFTGPSVQILSSDHKPFTLRC